MPPRNRQVTTFPRAWADFPVAGLGEVGETADFARPTPTLERDDRGLEKGNRVEARTDAAAAETQQLLRACAAARWQSAANFATDSLQDSTPTLVKRGDRRVIYRVDLPRGAVFVKHRHTRGFVARIVDLLRGAASRREFHNALEAERRGVPSIRPLAFATDVRQGSATEQLLVTAALPGAIPLDVYTELHGQLLGPSSNRRRALVEALASFCAQAHEAGLEHDDLHAGNILVVWPEGAKQPRLHWIDLDKARFGRPLAWRASRRNLAMLLCGLHHLATPRDLWRFWRRYRQRRPTLRVDGRQAPREIWQHGLNRVWHVLRDRDRRALRNNRQFSVVKTDRGVAFGLQQFNTPLEALLSDPEQLLSLPGTQALKLSFGSVVVKIKLPGEDAREIALKRVRAKSWAKRLLAMFRPSRARIGWVRGHALLARGVATATPLFALEPRPGTCWGESYLATEWIVGTQNLHLYLWDLANRPRGKQRAPIRRSAESLGALLGRMHAYGVSHRDLKGCNLTVVERESDVRWYLLDLEGVRLKRQLSLTERATNLARLAVSAEIHPCVSRADRWRFLRAYCRAAGQRDDVRVLWRAIAKACQRHLVRLKRQGKAVA